MDEDEKVFLPDFSDSEPHKIETPPLPEHVESARERLNESYAVNELLCYRLLKQVYGRPDYSVVYLNLPERKAYPYDWSYCVRIHEVAIVEIARVSHNIFALLWILPSEDPRKRQEIAESFKSFLEWFTDALRRARVWFDPRKECARAEAMVGVVNPCCEKYSAAAELMKIADYADHPKEWRRIRRGEAATLGETGATYLAAITYFYIAPRSVR
jgi:hypothetical protein